MNLLYHYLFPLTTTNVRLLPLTRTHSDYDTDNTGASSTLVDHQRLSGSVPTTPVTPHLVRLANSCNKFERARNDFRDYAVQKYGIHSRPQDIIDIMLSHVFGKKHADQIKVMHLALAPG
jgi:hypothetical protein